MSLSKKNNKKLARYFRCIATPHAHKNRIYGYYHRRSVLIQVNEQMFEKNINLIFLKYSFTLLL
jgi:hypothetical protein